MFIKLHVANGLFSCVFLVRNCCPLVCVSVIADFLRYGYKALLVLLFECFDQIHTQLNVRVSLEKNSPVGSWQAGFIFIHDTMH